MRETKRVRYELLFIILFFTLLLLNTFVRTKFGALQNIGQVSTILTFILMYGYLIKSWLKRGELKSSLTYTYIAFALMMAVFTCSYFNTDHSDTYYFLKVISLFFFILGLIRMKWNATCIKAIGYLSALVTISLLIHWIRLGFPTFAFESIFRNQNYLAVLLFSMFYFNILTIKYSEKLERVIFSVLALVNIILMLMTSARSVLIGTVVIIISWVILKHFKGIFSYLIYLVVLGNIAFVIVYVGIKDTIIGNALNQLSRAIFNKNLFSGRSELWEGVIQAIAKNPWFGYGVGINASDVSDTNFTAHNLYLQLLLEVGIVGFIVFFLLMLSIWKILNKQLDNFAAKWSACFLLGILVYESFELTLFQNNYSISMLQWLIITFGINFATRNSFQQKE